MKIFQTPSYDRFCLFEMERKSKDFRGMDDNVAYKNKQIDNVEISNEGRRALREKLREVNLFQWSGWRPKTYSHCGINCKYSDRVAETCEACDRGRTCGDSSFLYYGDGVYAEDA